MSRKAKANPWGLFFLLIVGGGIVSFFSNINILLVLGVLTGIVLITLGIYLFIKVRKQRIAEANQRSFPKQKTTEDIKQEINKLVGFVYAEGEPPDKTMPTIIQQQDILCQLYSYADAFKEYEPIVQKIFENAISKVNTYSEITDKKEFYRQLHFAFETLCRDIILVITNKSQARKYFSAITNSADRLLQMNQEMFKRLFSYVQEFYFWYVYNKDFEYGLHLRRIKQKIKYLKGILQTDFYKKSSMSKDDVSFTLYFAEKAGEVIRKKEGRSYRLYLPGDNINEIPNYEQKTNITPEAVFDYKTYWPKIKEIIKNNIGILQTEFYAKCEDDKDIISRSLNLAEKDGEVIRKKEGRSYRLYLPEQVKDAI
jgi:hypothetical protein